MNEGPDGRARQRRRAPDSIWERYLTGKLSLEDKETLPALIKELHREIVQHLGRNTDAETTKDVGHIEADQQLTPPRTPKGTSLDDVSSRWGNSKGRRIDPRQT